MDSLWLDDIRVGDRFNTDEYEISSQEIVDFAQQFDPQPFHLNDQAAVDSFFKGLAASGWHTAAITMRLLVTSGIPITAGIIGASVELAWPSPTRAGDILHVELTVMSVKISKSQPDRGFVTVAYNTVNQEGEIRQRTTTNLLAFKRPQTK